ncbi:MAG TPA: cytochrome b/b6 domain-containing protein [Thermoanaerobaculia bacterium]|jgi:undecaprenyl pyrophosphate phosphatase UppP|nr:cytochrome b/b6 domain-containing protein [Thermoanaerobaculia bacterium]
MKRWEAWSVHLSSLLVGATGIAYAWMRYLLPPVDPYSSVGHPLQPAVQHGHVLVAPLLVFATGIIWKNHVWAHWSKGVPQRRRSGLALLLALVPMVVSGYLLQTTVDEEWRRVWVIVHLTASALFLAGYAGHLGAAIVAWVSRRRRGEPAASAALLR